MKTLEEIKEEYAVELGFDSFEHMFYDEGHEMGEMGIDEIAKRYATACIQADRLRVAEKSLLTYEPWDLFSIIEKLATSTEYLLQVKNYDKVGWEEVAHCVYLAKEYIKNKQSIIDLPIELL